MMTDPIEQFTWAFMAEPYFDPESGEWKPSVRVTLNGAFQSHTVYDIGFDKAHYTLPYARDFARTMAQEYKQSTQTILTNLQNRLDENGADYAI